MKIKLFSVEGNSQKLDGGAMFGNAPRPVWEKWSPPDARGRIDLACRAMLVQIDDQFILCETGIGAFFDPALADRYGVQTPERHILLESLDRIGIKPERISYVILSHLHFDHAGGLLPKHSEIAAGNDQLLFPNAKYVVGAEAWERAQFPHSRDRASFIPELTDKLKNSGRLIIIHDKTHPDVFPDTIEFRFTEGHTPGHMHTIVHGEKDTVFYAGDLIPGMAWVHLPITMGYDRYPEKLIDEKSEVYKIAEPQNWWVFFTHDTKTAMAHIRKDERGKYSGVEAQHQVSNFEI